MEMNMKKSILAIGALIGSLLISSCGKNLEVTPPNNIYDEQIEALIAQGGDKANEIIEMFAGPMPNYFNYVGIGIGSGSANPSTNTYQGINWMRGLEGNDIVDGYSGTTWIDDYYGKNAYLLLKLGRLYTVAQNGAHWYGYAYGLKQANLLLKYCESLDKSSNLYKTSTAKAFLVRAFSYMSMMEEYTPAYDNMIDPTAPNSGLPIYTLSSASQEAVARSTAEETYKFILTDIQTAVDNLKAAGVGYTHEDTALEDLDLGVANYLKARCGQNIGSKTVNGKTGWAICQEACNEIINYGRYAFIAPENWGATMTGDWGRSEDMAFYPETNAFLSIRKAVNPEVILGYTNASSYQDSFHHALANIYGSYASRGAIARIDDRLYNKIDDKDCRKAAFRKEEIGNIKLDGGALVYMPSYCNIKYAFTHGLSNDGASHTTTDKNNTEFCKFRLSEVYLMLAESYAQQNDVINTKATLNKLLAARCNAGTVTLTCDNYASMAGMTPLQMVQLQYSIEMWGEEGREYFNNKRWKIDINRAGSANHADAKGLNGEWSKWQEMTLEFPENEQLYNPNYKADEVNTPSALK